MKNKNNINDRGKELLDIYTEEREKTGKTATMHDIHIEGFWHKAVHVWIVNSNNNLLIQKRSNTIINHPGKFDSSVGGHVDAGEDSINTAVRETYEELGLVFDKEEFKQIGTLKYKRNESDGIHKNYELDEVFILYADLNLEDDLNIDEKEVASVKWMSTEEYEEIIKNTDKSVIELDELELVKKEIFS